MRDVICCCIRSRRSAGALLLFCCCTLASHPHPRRPLSARRYLLVYIQYLPAALLRHYLHTYIGTLPTYRLQPSATSLPPFLLTVVGERERGDRESKQCLRAAAAIEQPHLLRPSRDPSLLDPLVSTYLPTVPILLRTTTFDQRTHARTQSRTHARSTHSSSRHETVVRCAVPLQLTTVAVIDYRLRLPTPSTDGQHDTDCNLPPISLPASQAGSLLHHTRR